MIVSGVKRMLAQGHYNIMDVIIVRQHSTWHTKTDHIEY